MRGSLYCALMLGAASVLLGALPSQAAPPSPPPALPANVTLLSDIGERPAFSPDSLKVAFVNHEFGDAYEMDLETGEVRNLTGNIAHMGITRVQYLPNGDYLITTPRFRGAAARFQSELWVLDRSLRKPLQPLGVTAFEGTAVSRFAPRLAWVAVSDDFHYPVPGPDGHWGFPAPNKSEYMAINVADIVWKDGKAQLTNRREVLRSPAGQCYLESQDFRNEDRELVYTCYETRGGEITRMPTLGLDLRTGKTTVFRDQADEVNEPEGVFPDGHATLTECKPMHSEKPVPLELCRLGLTENSTDYRKVTHFTETSDYGASNGVISPDGKLMAFQLARANGVAGQGFGIMLMRLDR